MTARYELHPSTLSTLLWRRGWLRQDNKAHKASPVQLVSALRAYQKFHGLKVDGWAGPVTERSLRHLRICGLPDRAASRSRFRRWPMKRITWTVTGALPYLAAADQKAAFASAWQCWSDVCGVEPTYTPNARTAHVVMCSGGIDRSGGALAWSEMPCGTDGAMQLEQRYDDREPWGIAEITGPGKVGLIATATHQIGHALGIPHLPAGALMQPTFDPRIQKPQAADIAEAQRRYDGNEDLRSSDENMTVLTIQVCGRLTSVDVPGFHVSKLSAVSA